MTRFCIGDKVQVAGLPSSQWQDLRGTVIEIVDHGPYQHFGLIQECAVDVAGQRRWFMAKHLTKVAPAAHAVESGPEDEAPPDDSSKETSKNAA
jgi:hypothetical protein